MTSLLTVAVGIGLAIGLLFAELFGIAAGGMVVPGYVALALSRPMDVIMTVFAGLMSFFVIKLLSPFLVLYGRRRIALTILVGYVVGMLIRMLFPASIQFFGMNVDVIGFIIPGLLAIWMDRQGVVETISTLLIVSVIIRLILIIILGEGVVL